jgi:hypothetical protein
MKITGVLLSVTFYAYPFASPGVSVVTMQKQEITCRSCGQKFRTKEDLDRHNNQAHPGMNSGAQQGSGTNEPNQPQRQSGAAQTYGLNAGAGGNQ